MSEIVNITNLSQDKINKFCHVLNQGQVLAYPTDTIYGLGVDAKDEKAAAKLFNLKQRSKDKPVSILYPSKKRVKKDFPNLNKFQTRAVKKLLPGAITVILPLPVKDKFPIHFQQNGWTGVRVIKHKKLNQILKHYPNPISTTSVNPHKSPPAQNIEGIKDYFGKDLALILKDEAVKASKPSTVVKLKDNSYEILREGALSPKQLQNKFQI